MKDKNSTYETYPPAWAHVFSSSSSNIARSVVADEKPVSSKEQTKVEFSLQVQVLSVTGTEFYKTHVSPQYTFGMLRRDACQYWDLPEMNYVLQDQNHDEHFSSCTWPEEVVIANVLKVHELARRPLNIRLLPKPLFSPMVVSKECNSMQPKESANTDKNSKRLESDYESELWNIFTFYSVHGNVLEWLTMTCYQFTKLMRDIGVLTPKFNSAMIHIIYAAEVKGTTKPSWGRMTYKEFLNALMNVAIRKFKAPNARVATTESGCVHKLLIKHVLPFACRWNRLEWSQVGKEIQHPHIQDLLCTFSASLQHIYKFYSPNQAMLEVPDGTEDAATNALNFGDFMKFAHDFNLSELHLSYIELGEVFLATNESTRRNKRSAKQLSLEKAENVHTQMSFAGFLNALGYIAFKAFKTTYACSNIHCMKALLQHLSRSLKQSKVVQIVYNRRTTSTYPGDLIFGSIMFNKQFHRMWKAEGTPDYLRESMACKGDEATKKKKDETQSIEEDNGRGWTALRELMSVQVEEENRKDTVVSLRLNRKEDHDVNDHLDDDDDEVEVEHVEVEHVEGVNGHDVRVVPISSNYLKALGAAASPLKQDFLSVPTLEGDKDKDMVDEKKKTQTNVVGVAANNAKLHVMPVHVRELLTIGSVFLKLTPWGYSHPRFVWMTPDLNEIHWRPVLQPSTMSACIDENANNQKVGRESTRKGNNFMRTKDVLEVVKGEARQSGKFSLLKPPEKLLRRCIALIGKYRRLELEAESELARNQWLEAFSILLKHHSRLD